MRKSEATREKILNAALALFRKQGFDPTTMRDVAKKAGVALGAAYYYFPSKEAVVMAYYEQIQAAHLEQARAAYADARSFRDRLAAALHSKLDLVGGDRKLLGAVFRAVGDPTDPLSTFGRATAQIRADSIAVFAEALGDEPLPADLRALAPSALWMLHLALLLFFIHDRSRGQQRTRKLVDRLVDLIAGLLPMLGLPALAQVREHLVQMTKL